ncbi:hypothetical protein D1O33_04295 [Rhodococcus rhodochrous]|uniref:Uncharacterized protein n=1 Tax=Rhodococcus pyridinivorans KG-16 TaxID=1441730 RepID=A0A0V9UJA2_9NOCA|nr:hypothetical protein Z045_12850 [Rhodococcus pyridinivorans KG-16]QHG81240.1 hypothetical protein D1O33_04295 [Rhodococcus rhodochrous]QOH54759.1 hypothetical protein C6Y44_01345 [Rhodococcus rhodochrous]
MTAFVIEYNRKTADRTVTSFPGVEGRRAAMRRRLELEKSRTDKDVEIVSLVSDSLETLRRTHSRYFQGRELAANA